MGMPLKSGKNIPSIIGMPLKSDKNIPSIMGMPLKSSKNISSIMGMPLKSDENIPSIMGMPFRSGKNIPDISHKWLFGHKMAVLATFRLQKGGKRGVWGMERRNVKVLGRGEIYVIYQDLKGIKITFMLIPINFTRLMIVLVRNVMNSQISNS